MSGREWIDVEDWNLRHLRPGAGIREASWGGTETDENGAVVRVAGRLAIGKKVIWDVDPETGEQGPGRIVETSVQADHPTREQLLAAGYVDRAEFPLDEKDAERDVPRPRAALKKVLIQAEPTRKVAEVTEVEPQDRRVIMGPDKDPGELGAPIDLDVAAETGSENEAEDAGAYQSPFSDGPPPGTSASDPTYNPPEGAPAGEQVEDAVASGQAEVLGDDPKGWTVPGGSGA